MYWLFTSAEGVEPTNNHAERVQRRAVLWRRKSFGCGSLRGCRFVERILTAVQTLRLQGRNALEFLAETPPPTAWVRKHPSCARVERLRAFFGDAESVRRFRGRQFNSA